MAKGKPDLSGMLPPGAREFAEGGAVDAVKPAPAKVEQPAAQAEVKKQTAVRLTPSTLSRITALAGKQAMESGKRVTQQDVMEAAILEYLERNG